MKEALLLLLSVSGLCIGWTSSTSELDPALLAKAKREYNAKNNKFINKRYLTIVDFRKSILATRLWVYDTESQSIVLKSRVSHAFRSGLFRPTTFSNVVGSEQSCYGDFITGEVYNGRWGYSMRLDGISASNTNARARAVIVHAGYTYSAACFMTPPAINKRLIELTKGKSLLVVYK